ncbi:small acid-soluble spore protein Tlp [Bacillus xiapuensis]|uniref:small acid-soluble spore protein Tlp n=1 Tax=Bacillus xiapuensis TaxID=2014075 RepID=UPI000C23DE2A|nr:small acid-soluble spore protein Tlp [Bacillus xiapuensis]
MRNQPKPDDRADNVEKLQEMVQNTEENIHEAEDSLQFATGEQRQAIAAKNERRQQSIAAFQEEISDEATARRNGYRTE